MEEKISDQKQKVDFKAKVKNFLRDKNNIYFLLILLAGIIIRIYYFSLTKSQPLWWDESDYLAYAKNLAGFNVDWVVGEQHSSIFPYVIAILFKIGFSEASSRFLVAVIPSILIIVLTYILVSFLYSDKRIALLSSLLMVFFWEILFDSFRFSVDIPALFFGLLAIIVFWQGHENKEKIFGKIDPKWTLLLTGLLVVLVYSIRRGYFLFGIFFIFYLILTEKPSKLIKNKYNWIALVVSVLLLIFLERFFFISPITQVSAEYINSEVPLSLLVFGIFSAYFKNPFNSVLSPLYYLFWIGFIWIILGLLIGVRSFYNKENKLLRSNLFVFLTISITIFYFLFIQRRVTSFGDPRWYFPLIVGSLICISQATLLISDYLKRYGKEIAVFSLIILIGLGGFYQMKYADVVITSKIPSFEGIKQAGILIKDNSNTNDVVFTVPLPQVAYYAERGVINPADLLNKTTNEETTLQEFLNALNKEENSDIKYMLVSFSEPHHPEWMQKQEYIQNPSTGQISISKWQIPFMDTEIDFINQKQEILPSKQYDSIRFSLLGIKEDIFIYRIEMA